MKPKKADKRESGAKQQATPSPEVQMEDAGTPASGNSGMGGRSNAAEHAMKQTSKTSAESGGDEKGKGG